MKWLSYRFHVREAMLRWINAVKIKVKFYVHFRIQWNYFYGFFLCRAFFFFEIITLNTTLHILSCVSTSFLRIWILFRIKRFLSSPCHMTSISLKSLWFKSLWRLDTWYQWVFIWIICTETKWMQFQCQTSVYGFISTYSNGSV